MASRELSSEPVELIVPDHAAGSRLDAFLAAQFTTHSRVKLRRAINAGSVEVNGQRTKAAYHVRGGDQVSVALPAPTDDGPQPENIPLDILYEDDELAVINKPANMVVHPSKGHWSGTLTAALAFHFDQLSSAGGATRPGIVHRLDRETSGVIAIAKTDFAHLALAAQFESREVEKEYFAIVVGRLDRDRDVIEQPIGVHPYQREKMAIRAGHATSRDARTFYEVDQRFDGFATVNVRPHTGRTHQIRIHLAHVGCPVLCDRLYGGRSQIRLGEIAGAGGDDAVLLSRQALHARRLKVAHPRSKEPLEFTAPLPDDMQNVVAELERHRRRGA